MAINTRAAHLIVTVALVLAGLRDSQCRDALTLGFIADVMESDALRGAPKRINAYTCWDHQNNKKLWQGLSQHGLFASVSTNWQHWTEADLNVANSDISILFIVDMNCESSEELLLQASDENLFRFPHRWLIIEDDGYSGPTQKTGRTVNDDTEGAMLVTMTSAMTDSPSDNILEWGDTNTKDTSAYFEEISANKTEAWNVEGNWRLFQDASSKSNSVDKLSSQQFDVNTSNGVHYGCVFQNRAVGVSTLYTCPEHLRSSSQYSTVRTSVLNVLPIYVDSQVFLGRKTSRNVFVLIEMFKRGPRESTVWQMVGNWSADSGLHLSPLMLQPVNFRRMDLEGTKIIAAMVVTNNDTLNHLTGLKNKHIDTLTKLNYALFIHSMEMLNASFEIIVTNSWGYPSNGTFNGMAGYLQRGEADMGVTALLFTKDRMAVLEYIAMTSPTKVMFVFRQPPLSYVSNVFTLPFSMSVWIASGVLVALTGVLLFGALHWEARRDVTSLDLEIEQHLGSTVTNQATWSDVALLSLGAVCQQGSTVEPRSGPSRLLTLTLFVAVIFLYTSYSASIVALLQSSTDSINTLSDLLHSRLDVGVHDIVYNHYFFKTTTDPVRKAIYEQKVAPPGAAPRFYTLEDGIRRVRKGLFAFHMQTSPGYHVISETFREEEKCGFKEISFLQVADPHIGIQRNSPYREMLKIGYRKILERGLQSRAVQRFYTKKPECTSNGSNFVSVGIVDFYPALLVLAYGTMCALGVLVLEVLVHKRWKMRSK